jgi:ABC-2 type transport system permease protein
VREVDGRPLDAQRLRALVAEGRFQVGLRVPAGLTAAVTLRAKAAVADGLAGKPAQEAPPAEALEVVFDPLAGGAFRSAVVQALERVAQAVETEARLAALERRLPEAVAAALEPLVGAPAAEGVRQELRGLRLTGGEGRLLAVAGRAAGRGGVERLPSAAQQNVPAWALFGVFFIAVPLAGTLIHERDSGLSLRLRILPQPSLTLLAGRLAAYQLVCLGQFGLILVIGRWLLPVLGAPALEVAGRTGPALLVLVSAAAAAAGFGVLLGSAARTYQQASMFGALAVVVAAALGGVMVPVFAMPEAMRAVSRFSPLAWGLEGLLEVFVRGGGVAEVLPQAGRLLLFAAGAVGLAAALGRRRI